MARKQLKAVLFIEKGSSVYGGTREVRLPEKIEIGDEFDFGNRAKLRVVGLERGKRWDDNVVRAQVCLNGAKSQKLISEIEASWPKV